MGAGLGVPDQLRRALPVVGARSAAGGVGAAPAGRPQPPVVDQEGGTAGLQPAGPHGAKPFRGGDVHARQWAAAGRVLDPAGRRLHARQGVADTDVLSAGSGGRHPRAVAGRDKVQPRHRISARGRDFGVVAGGGRLVAVGGELTGDGRGRHAGDLHRHRRRTTVLLPGHRQRAPVDRRRLPGLSADARGARRAATTPRTVRCCCRRATTTSGTWCPRYRRRRACRQRREKPT